MYNYFKKLIEENTSQEFRSKNMNESRVFFLEEIKESELMSIKQKMFVQL